MPILVATMVRADATRARGSAVPAGTAQADDLADGARLLEKEDEVNDVE